MGTESADEIVSPLAHGDTDRVCVVSASLVAECAVCGLVTSGGGAHVPFIAYGFRCAACCPCRTYVASEAEREAMAACAAGRAVYNKHVVKAPAETKAADGRRERLVKLNQSRRGRGRTMTEAVKASLEKAWAARRAKDAARKQVGPPL